MTVLSPYERAGLVRSVVVPVAPDDPPSRAASARALGARLGLEVTFLALAPDGVHPGAWARTLGARLGIHGVDPDEVHAVRAVDAATAIAAWLTDAATAALLPAAPATVAGRPVATLVRALSWWTGRVLLAVPGRASPGGPVTVLADRRDGSLDAVCLATRWAAALDVPLVVVVMDEAIRLSWLERLLQWVPADVAVDVRLALGDAAVVVPDGVQLLVVGRSPAARQVAFGRPT